MPRSTGFEPVPRSQDARAVRYPSARKGFGDTAQALADYTGKVFFGDVWERPGLSPRDRSLITVAALIAHYRTNELPFHLRKAIEIAASRDELIEVITHPAFYSGWPTANTAVTIANCVFEEFGTSFKARQPALPSGSQHGSDE